MCGVKIKETSGRSTKFESKFFYNNDEPKYWSPFQLYAASTNCLVIAGAVVWRLRLFGGKGGSALRLDLRRVECLQVALTIRTDEPCPLLE